MMKWILTAGAALILGATGLEARIALDDDSMVTGGGGSELPPYLQCVPYARQVSGIRIYGDAWTWWEQAEGRYSRGFAPKVGAVMALRPHGNSRLGHVAAVSKILDERTILIRHANWSPINGRRGQIEDNVKVIDVSDANDWSEVRVWYAPIQALGGSRWPVQGFIYPAKPRRNEPLARKSLPDWPSAPGGPRSSAKALSQADQRASDDPIGRIIRQKMGW